MQIEMLRCDTAPTRADVRRGLVLDVARDLFVEQGFHGTGMAQIASASGVKVGQIYRDFASKEDIIAAICDVDLTEWLEEDALSHAVEANDLDAIKRWVRRFVEGCKPIGKCRMMTEIIAETGRNARIGEINRNVDRRVRDGLDAALSALGGDTRRGEERRDLINLILAMGSGRTLRRVIATDEDFSGLDRRMCELLDAELDRLTGDALR